MNIIALGENHKVSEEIDKIRNKVIKLKPDIILHELDFEDKDYYKRYLKHVEVLPLEPSNTKDGYGFPNFNNLPIKTKFLIRENEMLNIIINTVKNNIDKKIVIVIGDTHLRTTTGNYFFTKSLIPIFIKDMGGKIIRSEYREIN